MKILMKAMVCGNIFQNLSNCKFASKHLESDTNKGKKTTTTKNKQTNKTLKIFQTKDPNLTKQL
jgi:hypothetical protein